MVLPFSKVDGVSAWGALNQQGIFSVQTAISNSAGAQDGQCREIGPRLAGNCKSLFYLFTYFRMLLKLL